MATKTERLEIRISHDDREKLERAASVAGLSLSAFLTACAVERAEEVLEDLLVTRVPADYFDRLLATIDQPEEVPALATAAARSRREGRIASR